jgi:hypothetical protein
MAAIEVPVTFPDYCSLLTDYWLLAEEGVKGEGEVTGLSQVYR